MIFGLFRRDPRPAAATLYGAIVAQSRRAVFYHDFGVPDTVEGRFDMIVLHLALLFRRLGREEGEELRRLAQAVFDMFCQDMEGNLREMGVGDLAVPKRMRGIAEAFYGRLAAYDQALGAAGAEGLVTALARNVFSAGRAGEGAQVLAAYVRETVQRLDAQDGAAFAGGTLNFPEPGAAESGNPRSLAKRGNPDP